MTVAKSARTSVETIIQLPDPIARSARTSIESIIQLPNPIARSARTSVEVIIKNTTASHWGILWNE